MIEEELIFPELIEFNDYGGNFQAYFDAVYKVFRDSFITSQPLYNDLRVSAQKHPLVDGIHRTFYHITHEGADESNRQPDFRRMERIRFPKFIINNNLHSDILIWKNKRGRNTRILMYNEAENYLVVLTERKSYYLFWTAYIVEREHRQRKLLKEYKAYINTKTA